MSSLTPTTCQRHLERLADRLEIDLSDVLIRACFEQLHLFLSEEEFLTASQRLYRSWDKDIMPSPEVFYRMGKCYSRQDAADEWAKICYSVDRGDVPTTSHQGQMAFQAIGGAFALAGNPAYRATMRQLFVDTWLVLTQPGSAAELSDAALRDFQTYTRCRAAIVEAQQLSLKERKQRLAEVFALIRQLRESGHSDVQMLAAKLLQDENKFTGGDSNA